MSEEIIIDIFVLTRNHEQFIERCINSILCQKCSYPYRVFIVNDCSTDSTGQILNRIGDENPHSNLTVIHNEINNGVLKTALQASNLTKSKYLCFMDGDDAWCFDEKLQHQIDFLEQNNDYAGCFHDAEIVHHFINQDNDYLKKTQNQWKVYSQFNRYTNDFMPWSLIERNIIPTASLVFRNNNISDFLMNYTANALSLSWAIHLYLIKNSKFKYFNEVWSIYNDHPLGVSKMYSISEFKNNNILILESLLKHPEYSYYKADIYRSICKEFFFILKSGETLQLCKREFKKLLKKYKYYLSKSSKYDIEQLQNDYKYIHLNNII